MHTTVEKSNTYYFLYLSLNKMKKYLAFFIVLIVFYMRAFEANSVNYRFTTGIYNQDEALARLKEIRPEDPRFNEELKNELFNRKKLELGKNILEDKKKSFSEKLAEFDEANKVRLLNNFLKAFVCLFNVGTDLLTKFINLTGVTVTLNLSHIATFSYDAYISENGSLAQRTPPDAIMQEIRRLKTEMEELLTGLNNEPVIDFEHRYILQKRHIKEHNSHLTKEIEKSLVQSRHDYFFEINIPSVECSLGLPLGPRILLDENNLWTSRDKWAKKFREDKSFSIYSDDIKNLLFTIISQIVENSIQPDSSSILLRVVEHWVGEGSTGKSTAAKMIARFLMIPYLEMRIADPGEISIASIAGTQRSPQGAFGAGWLVEALLKKTEEDNVYNNGLLILDDFPVNTPNAQSVLLAITDPDKKTIFNERLQVPIDISRLNIFIISNEPFRSLLKNASDPTETENVSDPTFNALTTRFSSTKFLPFNEEQKKQLAIPYLRELVNAYKPSILHVFEYLDPTKLRVIYDPELIRDMNGLEGSYNIDTGITEDRKESVTIREINRFLQKTIIKHIGSCLKDGTRYFETSKESSTRAEEDVNLSMAAYEGHPEAISEIVIRNMEEQDLFTKKETVSKLVRRYETTGNTQAAKEWLLKIFEKWGYDVVENETLLYQIQSEEDHKLLTCFLSLPQDHAYAEGIGKYFYNLGVKITGKEYPAFKKAMPYLIKSVEFGNQDAISFLYGLGKKILEREGYYSKDAIECYEIASKNGHKENKDIPEIPKKIKLKGLKYSRLENIQKTALQLKDGKEIHQMLGGPSWGYIECLWQPRKHSNGTSKNLTALKETMDKFEGPNDKLEILQFHLQLAESITDILINFEITGEPCKEIVKSTYRKENLKKLFNHLILLGDTSTTNQILNVGTEEFKGKAVMLIRWHKTWLGENNLKLSQFEKFFNLELLPLKKDKGQPIPGIPVGTPKYIQYIVDAALKLNDISKEEQQKGIYPMLGSTGRIRNYYGYIEYLWQPTKWDERAHEDLTALKERMDKFEAPDDKLKILQFHLQLAESITDILINFEKTRELSMEISTHPYRIKNLNKLSNHIMLLGDTGPTNQTLMGEEEFRGKAAMLIGEHKTGLEENHLKLLRMITQFDG